MSNASAGVGAMFRRWDGSVWDQIAEIFHITGPSKTRDIIDVTSLDSTDKYREFIAGFRDAGTVVLNMNFTRNEYDIMNTDYEDDTLQNYELVLPDAENTTLEFEGLVTELPLDVPPDDKISCDVTIKISGKVTTNSGSGPSPG